MVVVVVAKLEYNVVLGIVVIVIDKLSRSAVVEVSVGGDVTAVVILAGGVVLVAAIGELMAEDGGISDDALVTGVAGVPILILVDDGCIDGVVLVAAALVPITLVASEV